MQGLVELQEIIRRGDAEEVAQFRLNRIIPDEVSDDLYGTLKLASSKDFQGNILSPDELLTEAIEDTLTRGFDVFQLIGLALQNGASPNGYVTVNYYDEEGRQNTTILHILAYAWRAYLERGNPEDPTDLLMIVAILSAAGTDVKLPVTDPEILLERRRAIKKSASAAGVMKEVGEPRSVLGYLAADDSELADEILKYVAVFTAFRGTLADIKYIVKDQYFTAGDIQLQVPVSASDAEFMAEIAETIGEILDEPSHMSGLEGDEKLYRCAGLHANRCLNQLLEGGNVTSSGVEDAFLNAVESCNGVGVSLLIAHGFVPRYNHVDRVIFYGKLKEYQGFKLSAEMQTGILIKMVEHGVCLDHEQLGEVGAYSEVTFRTISEMQSVPYWRRVCGAPGTYVRTDLKNLARELDINPELDKNSLCEEFMTIVSVEPDNLISNAKKLQTRKRQVAGTTLKNLVDGDFKKEPQYENAHLLTRDVSDYSSMDLHCIRDTGNGQNYCFETIDYPKVLRSGINPYTNNPISVGDLEAIRSKRDTLVMLGLPLESTGIEAAMEKLRSKRGSEDYELWVRARRDHFLKIVDSRVIDLDSGLFANDESEGGLSIETMEEILNNVAGRDDLRLSPTNNREHALRSFALTFMEMLDEAQQVREPQASRAAVRDLTAALVAETNAYQAVDR
jgi:hypothetical protein